ncbi:acyl-CoA dehydrogenase family protein [Polymorphum gilvum]|uniref:Acyl-CoA dehydrogenase, C-terminal domain protein n=1 Tax=Polymorphum gilvum (strain LMG 25793 / CGMCC 1.9160 / SL003B-26A1) TaxID=991905 RepID=F2IVZ5_POLGS|nr:acyl-CoA dehydrogenase family protein [Polymorphum gilvum]ADZ70277.1 Acyl-CoA dehydrogenase, C-terminal domain protein [Polymorphum gilvum SL003B-26A1]
MTPFETHEVFNQPPRYGGGNLATSDPLLIAAHGAALDEATGAALAAHGAALGSLDVLDLGRLADEHAPVLKTHDIHGRRFDVVEYHPAYHALMRRSVEAGLHAASLDDGPWPQTRRAGRYFVTSQAETGHCCPITMTNAAGAVLKAHAQPAEGWLPLLRSRHYDQRFVPMAQKRGVTFGMGLTEKQGGTDLRAITTVAEPSGDGLYVLTGHKWFLSAPMSDAFLVLAKTERGPGCFLVPRFLPDGTVNGLRFQRLKAKLGNRSNASTEVEFQHAGGLLIGEEGRGIATILDMVVPTRIDCALGSAAQMRAAVARAVHHCRHRQAFGARLVDQPLMTRVLADMALDVAAATALAFRLVRAADCMADDAAEAAYVRLMTPAIKYWICKAAPLLTYEAMECLGGNGYVEDFDMARLYRDAPVNAIWEGSGNVMALDVLRALERTPAALEAVLAEFAGRLGRGGAAAGEVIAAAARAAREDPSNGRILTEQLALTGAAAALRAIAPEPVADAFIESRLAGQWRSSYGMLPGRHNARRLVEALYPEG